MSESSFKTIAITDDDADQTLAAVIKKALSCSSWGEARKVVSQRRVQINGNLCLDPARRLSQRDVLRIWRQPLPKPVDEDSVRFVYVDDDLVLIDKPPRITSARHFEERTMRYKRRQLQPTMEELLPLALAKYLRKQRAAERRATKTGEPIDQVVARMSRNPAKEEEAAKEYASKLKVIAVHRLDRDTTGLMLFARHAKAAERLGKLFRSHAIDRRYTAVVMGAIEQPQTFESFLIRDRGDGHRGSTSDANAEGAQHAVTHVRPVERIGEYTVIECKLETGRTHQIRIHLADAGHPLCGESIYLRRPDGTTIDDVSDAPRHALHSSAIRFVHPLSGAILKFQSPLPRDLAIWLERIRRSQS